MNDHIYISGKKTLSEDVTEIQIVRGKINENNIKFEKLIGLRSDKCIFRYSVHSGKIQSFKSDENKLLLSVNSSGWTDNPSMESLDPNSICGKILLIDVNAKNYEVYSSGHRNIIGLYSDKNVILSTEHGPYSGDEINNIKNKKSYGWPVASYGEKYSFNYEKEPFYKKNHELSGFEEPLFSFVPSIGISEIIKLPNNFSPHFQNKFIVSSLNGNSIFIITFDKNFSRVINQEKVFLNERIRDLKYDFQNKLILLALEENGELGILSLK
jgi:glucose/arabinose dehydrogenase